ncbi:MAG: hypothetical protein ACJ8R9_17230 [Steroidobacteraceae bacterium]
MTAKTPEQQARERIAQEYRDRGYDVVVEPRDHDLPDFLAGTFPDLLARTSHEAVLVEVRRTSALRDSRDLEEFARRITGRTGWRFELVTVLPERGTSDPLEGTKRLSLKQIREQLKEAERMAAEGHSRLALILAHAATEAALFVWAHSVPPEDLSGSPRPQTPRALIRQMAIIGVVPQNYSSEFRELEELRNALVHGFDVRAPSPSDVKLLIRIATSVLTAVTESNASEF